MSMEHSAAFRNLSHRATLRRIFIEASCTLTSLPPSSSTVLCANDSPLFSTPIWKCHPALDHESCRIFLKPYS